MPTKEEIEILVRIREGFVRARVRAHRDALVPAELMVRARRCLVASRRFERSGRLYASAIFLGMSWGYRTAAGEPFLGLHRR